MIVSEHSPLIGNRRAQGSFLCHRSSKGCTCQGDHRARKVERRTMKRAERAALRNELTGYLR